jgi:large subunit ribosomal protein L35
MLSIHTRRRDSGVQGFFIIIIYIEREFEMPKMKSNSGAAKRFTRNSAGNFKRGQSHLRHILTKKSSKRKRQLGEMLEIHANDVRSIRRLLPYS